MHDHPAPHPALRTKHPAPRGHAAVRSDCGRPEALRYTRRMELTTVDRQPVRVACLRYTGPFGPAIGEFWRDTVAPWLQANGLTKVDTYGVALDDAAKTPPDQLHYDACAEVPAKFSGTGLYHLALIPGGKYAV